MKKTISITSNTKSQFIPEEGQNYGSIDNMTESDKKNTGFNGRSMKKKTLFNREKYV